MIYCEPCNIDHKGFKLSKIECPSCGHKMVYVISGWECPMHKEYDK